MSIKPIFELLIDARGCYFELLVNDIPFYFHYKVGATSFRLPLNNFISISGKQTISLRMLSVNDGGAFPIGAEVILKIEEFEKDTPRERKPVIDYKTPNLDDLSHGVFTDKKVFNAEVPYLLSFHDSVNLENIDPDLLRKKIEQVYVDYTSSFKNNDLSAYKKLTLERQKNIFTSLYIDAERIKREEMSYLNGVEHNLVKLYPLNLYKLVFYGSGRLVGLQMKGEAPGIYIDSEKEEDAFIEYILFHKREVNAPLTIVL